MLWDVAQEWRLMIVAGSNTMLWRCDSSIYTSFMAVSRQSYKGPNSRPCQGKTGRCQATLSYKGPNIPTISNVCWKNHLVFPLKRALHGLVHLAKLESQTVRPGASPWLPEGVARPTARSLRQIQAGPSSGRDFARNHKGFSYFSVDFIHLYTIDLNVKDGFRL